MTTSGSTGPRGNRQFHQLEPAPRREGGEAQPEVDGSLPSTADRTVSSGRDPCTGNRSVPRSGSSSTSARSARSQWRETMNRTVSPSSGRPPRPAAPPGCPATGTTAGRTGCRSAGTGRRTCGLRSRCGSAPTAGTTGRAGRRRRRGRPRTRRSGDPSDDTAGDVRADREVEPPLDALVGVPRPGQPPCVPAHPARLPRRHVPRLTNTDCRAPDHGSGPERGGGRAARGLRPSTSSTDPTSDRTRLPSSEATITST